MKQHHHLTPTAKHLAEVFACQETKLQGFYRIRTYKEATGELVADTGEFPNIITDAGMLQWCTASAGLYHFVGTSSTTPLVTNTQMGAFLAFTSSTQGSPIITRATYPATPFWWQRAVTKRFAAGVAAGNLTEVGVGWSTSGSPTSVTNRVFSRALIVDGGGSPITLTVLPDEYLDLTYTLRANIDYTVADPVYVVNISGTNYTFTTRFVNVINYTAVDITVPLNANTDGSPSNTIQAWGGTPALAAPNAAGPTGGTNADNVSHFSLTGTANATFSAPTITMTRVVTVGLNFLNAPSAVGGITAMTVNLTFDLNIDGQMQCLISPPLNKTGTKILTLTFTKTITRI